MVQLMDLLDYDRVVQNKSYHFSSAREMAIKATELANQYRAQGKEVRVIAKGYGYYELEEIK